MGLEAYRDFIANKKRSFEAREVAKLQKTMRLSFNEKNK